MEDTDYEKATGSITILSSFDSNGECSLTASWSGNDRILITREFIEDANPGLVRRDGDIISICQFRVRIVGVGPEIYVARRVCE